MPAEIIEQFIEANPYLSIFLFLLIYPIGFIMLQYDRTAWIVVLIIKINIYSLLIAVSMILLFMPLILAPLLIFSPIFIGLLMVIMFGSSFYFITELWDSVS